MSRRQGQPLPDDLRARVISALQDGVAAREVNALFGVSLSWIYKARNRLRNTGETEPRPPANRPTPKLAPYYDAIRAEISRRPEATLQHLRRWLKDTHDCSVSVAVLWTTLQRLGLPLKHGRIQRWVHQPRAPGLAAPPPG